jgi:hypothetical protein
VNEILSPKHHYLLFINQGLSFQDKQDKREVFLSYYGYIIFMFPKRSLENILFLLCFLLLLLLLLLFSGTFLSGNVLRNYWSDQYETFQDDSLAFVDVPNDSHFF